MGAYSKSIFSEGLCFFGGPSFSPSVGICTLAKHLIGAPSNYAMSVSWFSDNRTPARSSPMREELETKLEAQHLIEMRGDPDRPSPVDESPKRERVRGAHGALIWP